MGTRCSVPDAIAPIPRESHPERPASTRRAMLAAVVVLSVLTVWTLRSLVPAALLGAWLAAVTEPFSARLARKMGGRTRAATTLTLGLLLLVVGAASVLVLPVMSDLTSLFRSLRTAHPAGSLFGGPSAPQAGLPGVLALVKEIAPFAGATLEVAASTVLQAFVFLATAYYLAIDGRRLQAGLERVSPFGPENTRHFLDEFIAVGRGIALSMGLAGVVTATMLGVAFAAVGAPRPVLLAALALVASMLPIGAHIVWIPVGVYLLAHGHDTAAFSLTAVGILGVGGLVDHVLRPWLVRFGRLELHPLLTILGLCGGVMAFGAGGVFLGPLIIAMTATAMRIHAQRPIMARRSIVPGERVTVTSSPPALIPPAPVVEAGAPRPGIN